MPRADGAMQAMIGMVNLDIAGQAYEGKPAA
jgi:hypothetical protein